MSENLISFKGSKDGIYIFIKEGSFQLIKEDLELKLKKSKDFFKGGKVISFKGRELTEFEKEELKEIIDEKYGISVNEVIEEEEANLEDEKLKEVKKTEEVSSINEIEEGKAKFIRTTLRSGQRIKYEGNIVVLADVNPGAELIASGNIIVLGSLRGIAHAGYSGNREAIVSAFSLQPTQLRIADIIARCPDNETLVSKWPEIARIKDNTVLIEPYLPKKWE